MDYKFNFHNWFLPTSNFKQKHAYLIINAISGSTASEYLKFEGYGQITFDKDDKLNKYPCVEIIDSFNRTKTNCIVYNINTHRIKYNKCFIYNFSGNKDFAYIGIALLNTETGECIDFNKEPFPEEVIKLMNSIYYSYYQNKIYEFYHNKYDVIKGRSNNSYTTCGVGAYNKLMNDIKEEKHNEIA